MNFWRSCLLRPQSLWIRKAFFQIHLWIGIAIAIYVAAISISGSAIVYRRELGRERFHTRIIVNATGRSRMLADQLREYVRRAYPAYDVLDLIDSERADRPDAVVLQKGDRRIQRFFDPYTGVDLGGSSSWLERALGWLADLHDNLLMGLTGRTLNGGGAFLMVLLALTGAVIWWPGIGNWRRSMTILWPARLARFNWGVHSAVGFWSYLFVLIWGISGMLLCFPGVLDFVLGAQFRLWITRLHFGRFNPITEALWTILGLAPAILALTGVLMWCHRVIRK